MMNKILYDERKDIYADALLKNGVHTQLVVACEELSECAKEICKCLRGEGNLDHLAEEVADATIMLEQLRYIHDINDLVCEKMDEKIVRLEKRLQEGAMKYGKS